MTVDNSLLLSVCAALSSECTICYHLVSTVYVRALRALCTLRAAAHVAEARQPDSRQRLNVIMALTIVACYGVRREVRLLHPTS